jgi:hypothetical protein
MSKENTQQPMTPAEAQAPPDSLQQLGSALMVCPFCGSPKVSVRFYNQPSVVCHNCLCMGPAASRLRKDNQAQCQKEASERWNLRPSADDELYHKLVGLIEWAETLLCNAECPKHCKPDEWRDILKRWRDEWHDSHKGWTRTPNAPGERPGATTKKETNAN